MFKALTDDESLVERMTEGFLRHVDSLMEDSQIEDEDVLNIVCLAWQFVNDEFEKILGQKPNVVPIKFFDGGVPFENEPDKLGSSTTMGVNIDLMKGIGEISYRKIQLFRVLVHEIYHSTAILRVGIKKKTDGFGDASINSSGVSSGLDSLGLEEGLAVYFEQHSIPFISQFIDPAGFSGYHDLLDQADKILPVRRECIFITGTNKNIDGSLAVSVSHYPYSDCLDLVEFLREEIPDFLSLVEKARVLNKPLELARAIESRFGSGVFRRLLTATVDDVPKLLSELKDLK